MPNSLSNATLLLLCNMVNGLSRYKMKRSNENKRNSFNLNNFFGFDENDVDTSFWGNSSLMNDTTAPVEFQQNKPYRLALYVRPMEQRRLHRSKASFLVKNTTEKSSKNRKNESDINLRVPEKGEETKKTKRATRSRVNNVMLFDENVKPESAAKRGKKTPEKTNSEKNVTIQVPSARKNILREVNTKSLTKTKQNKVRRSYERKFKEKETENIPEPPSEEIIKELEVKKLGRTKQRKPAKEDKEFEKWANNMNSDFDDVDKFELSIAYD